MSDKGQSQQTRFVDELEKEWEEFDVFASSNSGYEPIAFETCFDDDKAQSGVELLEFTDDKSEAKLKPEDASNPVAEQPKPPKNREHNAMSDFDDVIAKAVSAIPECVAAGYVDLSSGMMLGIKTVDSHPSEVMDFLAAATFDLFQGSNVVTIENIFKQARGLGPDDFHYFKEIIVNSENLIHVFIRGKQESQHVACFVCRLSANLGMVLTKARAQMPLLEAAV